MLSEEKIESIGRWIVRLTILMLAWHAGPFVWRVWLGPDPVAVTAVSAGVDPSARPSANYTAWNLFGRPQVAVSQTQDAVESAPETHLQLDLYGVVVGPEAESSGAIVAERGKEANYFRVDAILPGNARLAAVFPDKILLERGGVMETLSFDDKGKGSSAIQPVTRPAVNTAEDFMAVAEQRLLADPVGALASVGLAPNGENGGGYVFDGNNPMLSSYSLKKGDVLRSVNGYSLGNVEQDRAMMQQFYESGMLEVEIERDGAVFSISYPLR